MLSWAAFLGCRRGFCELAQSGRCEKVHDPSQVAVCQRWLTGACLDEKCRLQHKVSSPLRLTLGYLQFFMAYVLQFTEDLGIPGVGFGIRYVLQGLEALPGLRVESRSLCA